LIGTSSDITLSDFFCGAGGSSTGAVKALNGRGRVLMAANHWARAIETHNLNHPTTDHYLDDLQATHPSRYPKTTICWMSPECTNHSIAKGKQRKNLAQLDLWGESKVDPAEERSRATMREVVEFTAYHKYEIVIVENVTDIQHWQHYEMWLTAMLNLGYKHKALYLNAQFFDVPQSRDRIYIVFWKKGNRAPDLDFRPAALCAEHGQINAMQVWKKQGRSGGRYGKNGQYTYRCPNCGTEVKPFYRPAASVIDWSISSQRIGDRKKPLKPKTMERIMTGLRKFARPVIIDVAYAGNGGRAYPYDNALPTQTGRQTFALASMSNPPVILPPFLVNYYTREDAQSAIDQPIGVIPTENRHALVVPPFFAVMKNSARDGYTQPPISIGDPLTTLVASASQHALITPFITSVNHSTNRNTSVDSVMPTVMTQTCPSLVTPFVMDYYTNPGYVDVSNPLPTIVSQDHHALIETSDTAFDPADLINSCEFRMLEPDELKRGMSFPNSYVITGNKRDQVRQIGNAVCPNVAEWIVGRCAESLQ